MILPIVPVYICHPYSDEDPDTRQENLWRARLYASEVMRLRPEKWRFYAVNPLGSVSVRDYIDLDHDEEVGKCSQMIQGFGFGGVYACPGWDKSSGCAEEVSRAGANGLPVFTSTKELCLYDFSQFLEVRMVTEEATKTVRVVMGTNRGNGKHGPYEWLEEGEKHHLRKMYGHICSYMSENWFTHLDMDRIISEKRHDPGEDGLCNALCRLAMAKSCRADVGRKLREAQKKEPGGGGSFSPPYDREESDCG